MAARRIRAFLDSNVLIAGLASSTGAAAKILVLCEVGAIQAIVSEQILREAERNIRAKLPEKLPLYLAVVRAINPEITPNPSLEQVKKAAKIINATDAPILAAAIRAKLDYLVTLDRKHFHAARVTKETGLKVVLPGELLDQFPAP